MTMKFGVINQEDKTMKKILSNICTLAALTMMTAATFTACSSDDGNERDNWVPPVEPQYYHMTIQATKGMDTRALSYNGETKELDATWVTGETVTVKEGRTTLGTLTATVDPSDATQATLSGTLDVAPSTSPATLTLEFCSASYGGQDGTLGYISSHCDYATATTIATVSGSTITGTNASFTNQNAIAKFTLKEGDTALHPTELKVTVNTEQAELLAALTHAEKSMPEYVFTIPAATYTTNEGDHLFFALPTLSGIGNALGVGDLSAHAGAINLTLTATMSDGETYTYTKSGYNFTAGKYYSITVKMNRQPRTYDLSQATSSVTLKDGDTATGTMSTGMAVSIADDAEVTLRDVTVNGGISCNGSATIDLEGANTVGGGGYCGILINHGTLIIQGSGRLTATGSDGGAGIGGDESDCHVVIKGGTIVAQGSSAYRSVSGAGIGGRGERFGNITIEGGDVTATGGENAAGIGGGYGGSSSCGTISIRGGTVRATGGANAAGIGCGYANYGNTSKCGDITISGGTVTATAGTITEYNYLHVSAIGLAASLFQIGDVTVTDGINSVAMTNTNSNAGTIGSFIYGKSLNIDTSTKVNTSGPVGDYDYRTVSSSWNSSTKTWTLTKKEN